MTEVQVITWSGQSGKGYKYWIYPINASLKDKPGNFIFVKRTRFGFWLPCYIGETENLKTCLRGLEKEVRLKRYGATHIHSHLNFDGEEVRSLEEKDLIEMWKPMFNEELQSFYQGADYITILHPSF